jgi:hypothetical protein
VRAQTQAGLKRGHSDQVVGATRVTVRWYAIVGGITSIWATV